MNKFQTKVNKMIEDLDLILWLMECSPSNNCSECENNKICKRIVKARHHLLRLRIMIEGKP